MKTLLILSVIVAVSWAQDNVEELKLNWPNVHILDPRWKEFKNFMDNVEEFKLNWPNVHILDPRWNEFRNYEGVKPRISNGATAEPNEFPFQIGLYMQIKPETEEQIGRVHTWCGASLISDRWVLTAAHCVRSAESAVVFIGAHDINRKEPGRILLSVTQDEWIMHPEYDPYRSRNDIALIKLSKAVPLNGKINTINLPSRSQVKESIEGRVATVSGWGKLWDDGPTSDVLQFTNRKILPASSCRAFFSIIFRDTNICVDASERKSVCPGDSGGPLTVTDADGTKTLYGLTSFGHKKGCTVGIPTVFTRVSSYLDWISTTTGIKIKN